MDAPLGRGRRQRARGHRGHRDAEGPRPRGFPGAVPVAARATCWSGGACSRISPRRADAGRAVASSGAGLEKFRQLIERQGGDPCGRRRLRALCCAGAPSRHSGVCRAGYVARMKAEAIGRASMLLGAGRDARRRAHRLRRRDHAAGQAGRSRVTRATPLAELTVGAHAQVDQARAARRVGLTSSPRSRPRPCRSCSTSSA